MTIFSFKFEPTEKKLWLIFAAIELTYILFGRMINYYCEMYSIEAELLRTLNRIIFFILIVKFLGSIFLHNSPKYTLLRSPLLVISVFLFFSIPLLTNYFGDVSQATKVVFAVASIAVALHEEAAYRGVVQNLLMRHNPAFKSILFTTIIFTTYHIGALPWFVSLYIQVFIASLLLGIIYWKTNSLSAVVVIHAIYDALPSFTPIVGGKPPLDYTDGTVVMLIALIGVFLWSRRASTAMS